MSTADKLRAEGRAEGHAEGHAEGFAQGRVEMVLRLLNLRFGPLPEELIVRARSASSDDLDLWVQFILHGASLAAEFALMTPNALREEGRAEGRAEGHAEGRVQGKAEMVLRLLTARFGTLPSDLMARIRSAPSDDLDRWALLVLDATPSSQAMAEH
jgi:flagellar biosynthesis/type III secretory pathway protein FliH